jgi:hypothetical protein
MVSNSQDRPVIGVDLRPIAELPGPARPRCAGAPDPSVHSIIAVAFLPELEHAAPSIPRLDRQVAQPAERLAVAVGEVGAVAARFLVVLFQEEVRQAFSDLLRERALGLRW